MRNLYGRESQARLSGAGVGGAKGLLSRLGRAYRLDLRLLVRHWSYPLLHAASLALLVYMFYNREDRTAQALLETTLGRTSIGLVSLVGLFVAALGASRAQRVRIAELEGTQPTGFEIILGRWLASTTALLGFLLEPLAVAALFGPIDSLLAALPTFIGEAALTIAFTAAAGWCLVSWLPPSRWAYPLLAAGWLGFLLGPTMLAGRLPFVSLLNFMRQGISYYSELWQRLIYGDLFLWFNLFYAGLLLLFLGLTAWRDRVRRFYRLPFRAGGVMLVALGLAAFGGTRYVAAVVASSPGQGDDSLPVPVTEQAVVAEAYDLTLDLEENDMPRFEVEVTVRNANDKALDHLDLALLSTLEVAEADLPFERTGEYLRLVLPQSLPAGEAQTVRLRYAGPIAHSGQADGLPVLEDFVRPEGVRLSPVVAWYPVPVRPAGEMLPHPARVRLTVRGNSRLRFAANIPAVAPDRFESEDATWLFLIGSPHVVAEETGSVHLITSRHDLPRVRQRVPLYAESLEHLWRFFPEVPCDGLTLMILGEETGLPEGTPPSDQRAIMVVSRPVLGHVDRRNTYRYLAFDLWRLGGGALGGSLEFIVGDMALFFWMHDECAGDADCLQARVDERLKDMPAGYEETDVPAILLDVYRQGGEAGLVQFLGEVRARSGALETLAYDELYAWLQEAADGR